MLGEPGQDLDYLCLVIMPNDVHSIYLSVLGQLAFIACGGDN